MVNRITEKVSNRCKKLLNRGEIFGKVSIEKEINKV
jgi:hypothetical protein